MELIPLTAIVLGDRQRKYFPLDRLLELAEDIRRNGLLHAPVLPMCRAAKRRPAGLELGRDGQHVNLHRRLHTLVVLFSSPPAHQSRR